ncbi:bifunctional folylpolyglutamate synthase/dihydrofolate synthase [Persephonella sp.]
MKLYNLFHKKEFHMELGLERIKEASKHLGSPHEKFRSVLISGTNGKGSTAVFMEALFRKHSLKTGLFTSPHLIKENERWKINSSSIPDSLLEEYIEKIKPVINKYSLTYFEACTILAFLYFAEADVDVAVLEVGLGGRLDATNIVYPEVSVITNVSFDHTHILGDTLEKIAQEKLGIARKDRPLVVGSQQMEIIGQAVISGIREIYHYPKSFTVYEKENGLEYRFKNYRITRLKPSMSGKRQQVNCATALTGFILFSERNGLKIDTDRVKEAVSQAKISGRMEVVSDDPVVIIDGAHNEEAVMLTLKEIKKMYPEKEITAVFSSMKDKNWEKTAVIIRENTSRLIITSMPFDRSITERETSKIKNAQYVPDIKTAIKEALETADKNSIILITGSLYLAGEALKLLKGKK